MSEIVSPSTASRADIPGVAPLRIAVTGASGFFGGRVLRHLRDQGHTVFAFGGRDREHVDEEVRADYSSWDITAGPLESPPEVDAVVHCAAKVTDWGAHADFVRVNVVGTRNVLNTWPEARFVHISTASVYDDHHIDLLSEDKVVPEQMLEVKHASWLSSYAITKRLAEFEVATRNPNHAILRPHAIYGPNDTTILPGLITRMRRGKLFIPGHGHEVRISITHVDNLVHSVECALACNATGTFNVADAVTPTVHQALSAMFEAVAVDVRIVYVSRTLAWHVAPLLEGLWRLRRSPSAPPFTRYTITHVAWTHMLDLTRTITLLGYEPAVNFPESIKTVSIEPSIAAQLLPRK
ncbi:MAG: NAD(P)-dependent oxidoreductase [Thermoleophilia bacterium]|nr:NAD(P)-dependent oxidoreductase [Thermoleophilia bacterium]